MSPLPPTKYGGTFFIKKLCIGEQTFFGQIFWGMFYMGTIDQIMQGGGVNGKRFERSSSGKVLFSTGNIFLGKFGPKNQNWQFVLKFRTRLI